MKTMTWFERMRDARERLGLSKTAYAKIIGVSQPTVTDWENGEMQPRGKNLIKAAAALGMSPEHLLTGKGDKTFIPAAFAPSSVPLISRVQAGEYMEAIDNLPPGEGERIDTTVPVRRYTYALLVEGDSMEPILPAGFVLIVEPEMQPNHGDYVVVKNGDGEATVKQLIQDGRDWFLKPANPRYPIKPLPHDAIICGVVRAVERRLK